MKAFLSVLHVCVQCVCVHGYVHECTCVALCIHGTCVETG